MYDFRKESNSLLENQNAEAIMNIVNVIANKRNSLVNNELETKTPTETIIENTVVSEPPINVKAEMEKNSEESKVLSNNKSIPKKTSRKTKTSKSKTSCDSAANDAVAQIMSEQEIMTMPTLILCSEKDVESLLQTESKR
jgi:hypothetical protein